MNGWMRPNWVRKAREPGLPCGHGRCRVVGCGLVAGLVGLGSGGAGKGFWGAQMIMASQSLMGEVEMEESGAM